MNKLIKGAVTGAAGIALLLGGAGTFAAWNDSTPIGDQNTQIHTGTLSVAKDTSTPAGWYDVTKSATGTSISSVGSYLMVPGSEIEFRQPLTVTASGDQIAATVSFTNPTLQNGTSADSNFVVSSKLVDASGAVVSSTDNIPAGTHSYTAIVDVTFSGTATSDQKATLNLGQSSVTLTQTLPSSK